MFTGGNYDLGLDFEPWPYGRSSKLNRRSYAGVGPCFHLAGFHCGTGFLSHGHMFQAGHVQILGLRPRPPGAGKGHRAGDQQRGRVGAREEGVILGFASG